MNLFAVRRKFLSYLPGQPRLFGQVAVRRIILAHGETTLCPPAIQLPNDMDGVTAVMEDTTPELERKRIAGGQYQHEPTVALEFTGVRLHLGSIYRGSVSHRLVARHRLPARSAPAISIGEAAIASTYYGSIYFAHLLTDDLTLHLAAETLAPPVTVERRTYGHEPGYIDLLSIKRTLMRSARFRRLYLLEDHGQNRYKRERYNKLRSRLRASAGPAFQTDHIVMIRRGTSGVARKLVNETQVEQFLVARGAIIIEPESLTPTEIARKLLGSRIVVGVEGSHLAHGFMAMAERSCMLTLQPPYRFNSLFKDYTDCLSMRYASLTGQEVEGGFTIDLNRLARILDLIEDTLSHPVI
jgi:hypothetical protein